MNAPPPFPGEPEHLAPYRHFSLFREPFNLTPNRALFFPDTHGKVLSALLYAIERGDGIVKVVGEVGTGKTLLCRLLLERLTDSHALAYITAPRADPAAIASTICREFGLEVETDADPFAALGLHLIELHRAGRRAVLIIDEAQALDRRGLETVRLLTNYETDERKLLTIVLFGQPELDAMLDRYELRQLAQRVSFGFQTGAFDRATARRYVQHRIDLCTDRPSPHRIFSDRALNRLARRSKGVPRLLNLLADRALIAAFGEGRSVVEPRHVEAALREGIGWRAPDAGWFGRLFAGGAAR